MENENMRMETRLKSFYLSREPVEFHQRGSDGTSTVTTYDSFHHFRTEYSGASLRYFPNVQTGELHVVEQDPNRNEQDTNLKLHKLVGYLSLK